MPAMVRRFQASKLVGSLVRKIIMATIMAIAPNVVLQKATPIGVRNESANSINKKDPPQINPATVYIATQGFLALLLIYLS
jgi:predicted glycosyltransferase